jgi:WD40 repeat protein
LWLTTPTEAAKISTYKKPKYMRASESVESFIKKSINNPKSALSSEIKLPEYVIADTTTIFSVAISNAGIALGCYCGAVYLIKHDGEMITFNANAGAILSVAFINNGLHILAGGYDDNIRMWNTQRPTDRPIIFPSNGRWVNTIAVHPTGWFISAGQDGKMNVWYEMMGEVQLSRVLRHPKDGGIYQSVSCVSFSHSGETFASGGEDGIVKIWDSDTLKEVEHIIHHDETKYVPAFQIGVTAVVYIDEEHFVSGGRDGRVCLWYITGERLYVIESKNTPVNSIAFRQKEGIISVAYEKWGDGNLDLFDANTGKRLQSLDVGLAPKSVAIGRDGKIVSGGTGGFVVILSNERTEYAAEQVVALREGIAQSNTAFEEAVKDGLPPPPPKKGSHPDEKSISILTRLPEKAQEDVLKYFGGKHTKRKQKRTNKQNRTSKRR